MSLFFTSSFFFSFSFLSFFLLLLNKYFFRRSKQKCWHIKGAACHVHLFFSLYSIIQLCFVALYSNTWTPTCGNWKNNISNNGLDIRCGIHQGACNVLKNHHVDSRLISLCTYQISRTLRSSSVQFWKFQNVISHLFVSTFSVSPTVSCVTDGASVWNSLNTSLLNLCTL